MLDSTAISRTCDITSMRFLIVIHYPHSMLLLKNNNLLMTEREMSDIESHDNILIGGGNHFDDKEII